jgi:hypothetical protein
MRVGILTFHSIANYGATLQAYALFQALKMADYDVELINCCTARTSNLVRWHLYATPYCAFNAVKQ